MAFDLIQLRIGLLVKVGLLVLLRDIKIKGLYNCVIVLTTSFIVSDNVLNTYKNASFVAHLRKHVTWDHIKVLIVWDRPIAPISPHIILALDSGIYRLV